jgi:hypothetical protein
MPRAWLRAPLFPPPASAVGRPLARAVQPPALRASFAGR